MFDNLPQETGERLVELAYGNPVPRPVATLGTMHRAKGLEFKIVIVVGCEENVLPLASVLATFSDEVDRQTFVAQEKCLFYVACTRARERLFVTYVGKRSSLMS